MNPLVGQGASNSKGQAAGHKYLRVATGIGESSKQLLA